MKRFKTLLFSSVPALLSIGIQFLAVYYLLFIAAIFIFGIAPSMTGEYYSMYDLMGVIADTDFNTLASIIFSVTCAVVFGIWYYKSCGGDFRLNIKKDFHGYEILGIILLVPGTQFLSSIIISIVATIFPSWLEAYEILMESAGLTEDVSWLMMLYSVILAPIGEELIFRGVTLRIGERAFPFWFANCLQAALFGAFHMNMLQGCYAFVLGLVLGYVCEKGGSIYHGILLHFLFNLWGMTASEWLVMDNVILEGMLIIVGAVACTLGGFALFKKGNNLK